MNKTIVLVLLVLWLLAARCGARPVLDYKGSNASVDDRVEALMAQMTLEEKIGQMCQYVAPLHIEESKKRIKGEELIHNVDWD